MTTFAEAARDRFRYDDRGAADTVRTEMVRLPRGQLGYAQVTANQGSIGSTPTDLTGLTTTVTVAAGSRRVRVSALAVVTMVTANNRAEVSLLEDGVVIQTARLEMTAGAYATLAPWVAKVPTAGSHTYKVQAYVTVGGSTLTLNASATAPACLLVEDLGAA